MTLGARDLLARLLDATPDLPGEPDVEQLLGSFEQIIAQRAAIIATVAAPITLSEIDRPLLIELERRQGLWHEALSTALRKVGERRCGAAQLRAYAGPR